MTAPGFNIRLQYQASTTPGYNARLQPTWNPATITGDGLITLRDSLAHNDLKTASGFNMIRLQGSRRFNENSLDYNGNWLQYGGRKRGRTMKTIIGLLMLLPMAVQAQEVRVVVYVEDQDGGLESL